MSPVSYPNNLPPRRGLALMLKAAAIALPRRAGGSGVSPVFYPNNRPPRRGLALMLKAAAIALTIKVITKRMMPTAKRTW